MLFKMLYAPWRKKYVTKVNAPREGDPHKDETFRLIMEDNDDAKNFILKRFKHNIVMLNRYPYNAGHLMVIPIKKVDQLDKMSPEARAEMMELATHASRILQDVLGAAGINIGLNIGKASGAGIPGHLHLHVLPRWAGDTNFLPILGQTKQVSVDLNDVYKQLKPEFEKLTIS